jgi:hypothetical protein
MANMPKLGFLVLSGRRLRNFQLMKLSMDDDMAQAKRID